MAIRKTLNQTVNYYSDFGEVLTQDKTFENAYIEVVSVGGSKTGMDAVVAVYESEAKESEVWRKRYTFPPSVADGSQNFFRQAYEHIKKLPDYAGGEDC